MARRGGRVMEQSAVPAAAPTQPVLTQPVPAQPVPDDRTPWQSRNVDALAGDELRAYARRIGVQRRDCEGLTEDRLRQNCKLFIANYFEMIVGD